VSRRRTTPIVADVNNKQDLARVEAKLKDDPSITMLVNNAGPVHSIGATTMTFFR
jgi:uncharacterized protein